jgi:hypothetical protein
MQRDHLDDLLAFRGSTDVSCGARRATADAEGADFALRPDIDTQAGGVA